MSEIILDNSKITYHNVTKLINDGRLYDYDNILRQFLSSCIVDPERSSGHEHQILKILFIFAQMNVFMDMFHEKQGAIFVT